MVVAALSRALAARGLEVGITCLEEEGVLAPALRADGIRVSVVTAPGLLPNVIPGRRLTEWLREVRPDVVHAHSGVWLKAVRAARGAGVKRVVFTAHGLLDHTPRHHYWMMRLAARGTDRVVGVSDDLTRVLIEDGGSPPDRTLTISNGVDTDAFRPGSRSLAVRAPLGLGPDVPLVGIVARLAPVKDHACLIEAFALVHQRRPDAVLALVGDGPLRGALEAQVKSLGLASVVRFAGPASSMPPIYRDLDVFVLSSTAEGTSVSVLEAMATGLPVVATAVGGTPALLDGGSAGLLVPSGDPTALAGALVDLLDDPARRRALGAAARLRAERLFSERAMVDRYLELYGLGSRAASRTAKEVAPCVE
jgi:glycosyltransferase involved in cell wall biosynthesis